MPLILVFVAGVANFALYRAVMDSEHPMLAELAARIRRWLGPWGLYAFEAVVLVAALHYASEGSMAVAWLYAAYFGVNLSSYFMLQKLDLD